MNTCLQNVENKVSDKSENNVECKQHDKYPNDLLRLD